MTTLSNPSSNNYCPLLWIWPAETQYFIDGKSEEKKFYYLCGLVKELYNQHKERNTQRSQRIIELINNGLDDFRKAKRELPFEI
jgi:hypothetical protein